MYLLFGISACTAGYFFYRWRGDVSLTKKHRHRQDKKHSLMKLLWGFLTLTTLPGLIALSIVFIWNGSSVIANTIAVALFGFAAGGLLRFPATMATFRKVWPRNPDDKAGRPRSAA